MYFHGGDNQFKISIRKSIQNNLISFINRLFLKIFRKKNIKTTKKFLHIGSGQIRPEKFENLDFFSSSFSFWKKKKFTGHDLRFMPLPYDDETFEGAYSEHSLEHLYFDEAKKLLKEVCRVLKKNSIFRVTAPGINIFIDNYNSRINDDYFNSFDTPCDAIRDITFNWGHLNVWDDVVLKRELLNAGFNQVKVQRYLIGDNKNLILDGNDMYKPSQTIYLEAKR